MSNLSKYQGKVAKWQGKTIVANKSLYRPEALDVSIYGYPVIGTTIQGIYTFSDKDHDSNLSIYRWYRSNTVDGSGATIISNETSTNYVVSSLDASKYIGFEITPISNREPSLGTTKITYSPHMGNYVAKALGGTIVISGNDIYHMFTSDGTFEVSTNSAPFDVSIFVIGKGGTGGTVQYWTLGGGGGAGEVIIKTMNVSNGFDASIKIGVSINDPFTYFAKDTSLQISAKQGGDGGDNIMGLEPGFPGGSGGGGNPPGDASSSMGDFTSYCNDGYGYQFADVGISWGGGGGGALSAGVQGTGGTGITINGIQYARGGDSGYKTTTKWNQYYYHSWTQGLINTTRGSGGRAGMPALSYGPQDGLDGIVIIKYQI